MPGYRSGFVAGDPELIALLKRYRPNVGIAPQEFVQRARSRPGTTRRTSRQVRARYRAKRDVLLRVLEAHGLRSAGGDATFFLWLDAGPAPTRSPSACSTTGSCSRPGSFFGPAGAGYLRLALVPTLAECERAAERLDVRLRVQRRVEAAPAPAARHRLDRAGLRSCGGTAARRRRSARAP